MPIGRCASPSSSPAAVAAVSAGVDDAAQCGADDYSCSPSAPSTCRRSHRRRRSAAASPSRHCPAAALRPRRRHLRHAASNNFLISTRGFTWRNEVCRQTTNVTLLGGHNECDHNIVMTSSWGLFLSHRQDMFRTFSSGHRVLCDSLSTSHRPAAAT